MAETKGAATGAEKAPKTHPCTCRTGTTPACDVLTENSFARGHDARMSSRLANAVASGKLTLDKATEQMRKAGGSDLLVGKMQRAAKRLTDLAAAKAEGKKAAPAKAKAPSRAARGAAKTADDAATEATGKAVGSRQTVTVHHNGKAYKANVVVDASGDTVARHTLAGKECDHDLDEE